VPETEASRAGYLLSGFMGVAVELHSRARSASITHVKTLATQPALRDNSPAGAAEPLP